MCTVQLFCVEVLARFAAYKSAPHPPKKANAPTKAAKKLLFARGRARTGSAMQRGCGGDKPFEQLVRLALGLVKRGAVPLFARQQLLPNLGGNVNLVRALGVDCAFALVSPRALHLSKKKHEPNLATMSSAAVCATRVSSTPTHARTLAHLGSSIFAYSSTLS